jgi:hypothetical protein
MGGYRNSFVLAKWVYQVYSFGRKQSSSPTGKYSIKKVSTSKLRENFL